MGGGGEVGAVVCKYHKTGSPHCVLEDFFLKILNNNVGHKFKFIKTRPVNTDLRPTEVSTEHGRIRLGVSCLAMLCVKHFSNKVLHAKHCEARNGRSAKMCLA